MNNDDHDQDNEQSHLESVLGFSARLEMPELFYSEETRRPFQLCIDCGAFLPTELAGEGYYYVHKTIVRSEAVFEFAMCLDCNTKLQEEFSRETQAAIQRFCAENIHPREILEWDSIDEHLECCVVCRRTREECHRFSLAGFGVGFQLIMGVGPFLMCDDCESQMSELVSEKTRKEWDRFVEENFDSPPGVSADWPQVPLMV